MGKLIETRHLSPILHMSQCRDGFWLYDDVAKMNLAIREETAEKALVGALTYYQKRLTEVEAQRKALHTVVAGFVTELRGVNDDEFNLIPVEETEDL